MTDIQPSGLLSIAELLETLADTLSADPAEGRTAHVAQIQRELAELLAALGPLIESTAAEEGNGNGIACVALSAVRESLLLGVRDRLAAAVVGDEATVAGALATLATVCRSERVAVTLLMRKAGRAEPTPDVTEPPLNAWAVTLRRCVIEGGKIRTEYTTPDRRDAESPAGITVYGLSTALAFLRTLGITHLLFDNADGFSAEQRMWLANSARKVFMDCGSRGNLVVNATVCVPARGVIMYTHLSFFPSGTCRIRFEAFPAPVLLAGLTPADQAKAALVARYELKALTEQDGGVWTPGDLAQLASAFLKLPDKDLVVLRGLTFIRKKSAPTDTEATKEAGSYRFSDRTISLLDAAFCADDFGFVGTSGAIGPYSHWTILHEVGHAVEKYRWEQDYRQWDPAATTDQVRQLEAERDLLKQPQTSTDPSSRTRLREVESLLIELTGRLIDYGSRQTAMVDALRRNQSSSVSLRAFVDLVVTGGIAPCTGYAHQSWHDKHGEFFAEAYSLFLNEPLFLAHISKDLHTWFDKGVYRASWTS